MSGTESETELRTSRKILFGLGVALATCMLLASVVVAYPLFYSGRIYPGVRVHGMELGGLSVEEARAVLSDSLPPAPGKTLLLQGDGHSWELECADVGHRYNWDRTAESAYQVARTDPWYKRGWLALRIRFVGRTVEPHTDPADPSRVTHLLNTIAAQLHVAPTDAALHIDADGVRCVPGKSGRALDVEATMDSVTTALSKGAAKVELETVVLPPDLPEPQPGCEQAQILLSRTFVLAADDPLTLYQAQFEVPEGQLATWLSVRNTDDQVVLEVEEDAVETWLQGVAGQLGAERILDPEETLRRILSALREGEHEARCAIQHPDHRYVVEPGDTLFDIAYSHGFPLWRLEEANPDVEPGELLIGMELTIPSIDVLFPEPLVPGKRIEINLPEQRLRAYEEEELVYDLTCSSGMTSTPTIAGQFQVLFKEPEAYAQRWSLEMPYFMAIYYEGPDFANGIHELPIRANGQRLWASVLGWPASYGCIILDVGDAEKLYDWTPVGTLVRIEGVAPGTPVYVPTYDDQDPDG